MRTLSNALTATTLVLMIAACGGGGEDSPDPVATAPAAATAPAPSAAPGPNPAPPVSAAPGVNAPAPVVASPAPSPVSGPPAATPSTPAQPPAQTPPPAAQQPPPAEPLPPATQPTPAVVRTTMNCQALDGSGNPWQVDFEVDTREQPWRALWAYGQFSGYWQTDANGDIVHKRGIGAVPPPGTGINGQPEYYAEVSQSGPNTTVTIGSQYFQGAFQYTMQAGRMLRALRTSTNVVGTECYANP